MNGIVKTGPEVIVRIGQFVTALEAYCNEVSTVKHIYSHVIEAQIGKKYARIVRRDKWPDQEPTGGSAHCFIDLSNGNILKADGWKKPAPQVRGNIFKEDFDIGQGKAVGEFGAAYLR
jgi:hypothetical protein